MTRTLFASALLLSGCASAPTPLPATAVAPVAVSQAPQAVDVKGYCNDMYRRASVAMAVADSASADCLRDPGPANSACAMLIGTLQMLKSEEIMDKTLTCFKANLVDGGLVEMDRMIATLKRVQARTGKLAALAQGRRPA